MPETARAKYELKEKCKLKWKKFCNCVAHFWGIKSSNAGLKANSCIKSPDSRADIAGENAFEPTGGQWLQSTALSWWPCLQLNGRLNTVHTGRNCKGEGECANAWLWALKYTAVCESVWIKFQCSAHERRVQSQEAAFTKCYVASVIGITNSGLFYSIYGLWLQKRKVEKMCTFDSPFSFSNNMQHH